MKVVAGAVCFLIFFFIESFLQMCFEGKWLQNRLRADGNELRSLSAVDIQGHQRGGFCIVPSFLMLDIERHPDFVMFSSSRSSEVLEQIVQFSLNVC